LVDKKRNLGEEIDCKSEMLINVLESSQKLAAKDGYSGYGGPGVSRVNGEWIPM
jgi:hypothetical protein